MKKILLLSLFSLCAGMSGQVYNAGIPYANYTDVNPDQLMWYQAAPYTNNTYNVSLFVNPNDVQFTAHGAVSSGGSDAYINVMPMDPNVSIAFGRWDSVYAIGGGNWVVTKVARIFNMGEQINASGIVWDNGVQYLTDHSGHSGGNKNVNDWIGGDKFLAAKYQNGSTVEYGWIRVNCITEDSCYLKEYSSTAASSGIAENAAHELKLYPNPAGNFLYLQNIEPNGFKAAGLKLTDIYGKEYKLQCSIQNNRIRIDFGDELANGCYLLQYSDGNKIFTKKVFRSVN